MTAPVVHPVPARVAEGSTSSIRSLADWREQWLAAPDVATQKKIVDQMQLQAFQDAPYVPTGHWTGFTCFNKSISGIQNGWPVFWNVRKG